MIEQPLAALLYTADLGNLTGTITPFGAFLNAQDLFGDETADIAASARASLPDWAASVSAANGGLVDAVALLQAFEVQHDVIFRDNVTIIETLTSAVTGELAQVGWPLLPFSRGSVHIQAQPNATTAAGNGTVDIANRPAIDPKYLLADFDLTVMTAGGRIAQAFVYQAPLADLVTGYASPGDAILPRNATDAQWEVALRGGSSANHHALGTAAMMSRELGGVVDPQLRVYGTRNVRVVDASVLPTQISGHLTATLYAVADRAAAIILGKA
jgi:choline dehydrogenase